MSENPKMLVSVEELINIAMGPAEKNILNYKLLQTVLQLLARRLRMLETKVEIRISDDCNKTKRNKTRGRSPTSPVTASSFSKDKEKAELKEQLKAEEAGAREIAEKRRDRAETDKQKAEKEKAEEAKEKEKIEKKSSKEQEKYFKVNEERELEKMTPKEQEKYLGNKEQERKEMENMSPKEKYFKGKEREKKETENMTPKKKEQYVNDNEKEKQGMEKMTPDEKEIYVKEKETENIEMENMSPKEKEKYVKDKDRKRKEVEKMTLIEKEKYVKENERQKAALLKKTPKEKEKYLKGKEKEKNEMERMSSEEKEEYIKGKKREKTIMEKFTHKEQEKYLKDKESEVIEIDKMSPKEKGMYVKNKEEEKTDIQKMTPKEQENYLKHKEKERIEMEKMTPKEKEKYLKDNGREKTEIEKNTTKEQENYLKHQEKERKEIEKITPKEKEIYLKEQEKKRRKGMDNLPLREQDKYLKENEEERLLRMKRGRTTSGSITDGTEARSRGGGIEVVTQSEFRLLEDVVMELKEKARPLPIPTLPDRKKLRSDLATGRASLTDTMDAMQVLARMQAAEQTTGRMVGLLNQLATAGVLPKESGKQFEQLKTEFKALQGEGPGHAIASRKSVGIDPMSYKPLRLPMPVPPPKRMSTGVSFQGSYISHTGFTHDQMNNALLMTKEELIKKITTMTQKATTTAEMSAGAARRIAENFDVAMNLNKRINSLYGLASDYAEQLTGFDAGIHTQMKSFSEQIEQMKGDLQGGLMMLGAINNNAETVAVLELTNRYECISSDLAETLMKHLHLGTCQRQLDEDLHSLMQEMEILREMKADRDEVLDGLRDKADNTQLQGLLTEHQFKCSQDVLEMKLSQCYSKFERQEIVWSTAIKDLTGALDAKAEMSQLLNMKEEAQKELQLIQDRLEQLAIRVGQPKAAVLTRLLSKDGVYCSCKERVLMVPTDADYGQPRQLPALYHPPDPLCSPPWLPLSTPNVLKHREHMCKRWVGGSHTLLSIGTPREIAAPLPSIPPPTRYCTDFGSDGKIYLLEDELLPCMECNKPPPLKRRNPKCDIPKAYRGAGDSKFNHRKVPGPICDCLPTIR